jgi:hypothetical protein
MIPAVDQSRFHGVKPEDVLMKFVRTVDLARCERDLDFPAAAYCIANKWLTIKLKSLVTNILNMKILVKHF